MHPKGNLPSSFRISHRDIFQQYFEKPESPLQEQNRTVIIAIILLTRLLEFIVLK